MKKIRAIRVRLSIEALIWLTALIALALLPAGTHTHFSFCPLSNLGFEFCPGCGLGRSVSQAFHGQFKASFASHPLGLFAIIILSYRIITLSFYSIKSKI
ncbi:DUF2752 domain-containing protein [Fulvivirga ulvae]|uniref:DUF2752 domain-containing protein n=1 Tax=Fulvivirga ulvae TaxID=2904245 RepID=UPI001F453FD4|nr:DUF2752 domain-containing protein [Fulvivirga ulvae]UII32956.1 DUF2752 domain-containing protein [Fulvivirga ulvae]